MKLPNHTSLKEWSSAIDALGRGEQILLIRKGGIADPKFGVEAERFYLFPTYFHEGQSEPPATVTITHWCEVVRTWRVRELETLFRLEPLVVFGRAALEERYRFRPDQAAHVLAVRTYALAQPVTIANKPEYAGCRSWISVDDEIETDGSVAVLSEAELQRKIDEVDSLLRAAQDDSSTKSHVAIAT
jgi:hypothetical protein